MLDNYIPAALNACIERDQPLSFHWQGVSEEQISLLVPSTSRKKSIRASAAAIATNLYLANLANRWVSYSRDRNHYTGKKWYYGVGYSYANVLAVVEALNSAGLIVEDRARAGQSGWQSRIKANPDFIDRLGPINCRYEPTELVRLKNAQGLLQKYPDSQQTRT